MAEDAGDQRDLIEVHGSFRAEPVAQEETVDGGHVHHRAAEREAHRPLDVDDAVGAAGAMHLAVQAGQPAEEAVELRPRGGLAADRRQMRLEKDDVVGEEREQALRRRRRPAGRELLGEDQLGCSRGRGRLLGGGHACRRTGTPLSTDCPTTDSTNWSSVQSFADTPGRLAATRCHGAASVCPQPCGRLTTPGRISSLTCTAT
jgi:hypothetical protein